MGRLQDMLKSYKSEGRSNETKMWESILLMDEMFEEISKTDYEKYCDFLKRQHEIFCGPHFNGEFAKWQVAEMYHTGSDGKKYAGEVWSLEEVQEIASRHKSSIPSSYNIYDVYVAMNASYQDFCKLYKTWFPDNFKEKIIETAITFWFKDEDYGEGKVWDYFDD